MFLNYDLSELKIQGNYKKPSANDCFWQNSSFAINSYIVYAYGVLIMYAFLNSPF